MVALNALQSYYEYTGDPRVLELMQGYFQWELALPDELFLPPFWQQQRAGDNMASVYWLYNRTGREYLLQLAAKDSAQDGQLDRDRAKLAQRQHRPVLPCPGRLLSAGPRSRISSRRPSGTIL